MQARVIIVSRNYLGSINHSLLTATVLRKEKLNVAGWIFTDEYKNYEEEIAQWSGYPVIARIKHLPLISKETIQAEAFRIRSSLKAILCLKNTFGFFIKKSERNFQYRLWKNSMILF